MKTLRTLALALAIALVAVSCDNSKKGTTPEGLPTKVSLSISSPSAIELTSTKASDLQETNITTLALFFYRTGNTSKPAAVIELDKSSLTLKEVVSSTNYIYSADFEDESLTSGEYYLYAVANYDSSTFGDVSISDLSGLSLDALKQETVERGNTLLDMVETSMLLTGIYGRKEGVVKLKEGDNVITEDRIHLRRVTAKIIFKFQNGTGVTFTPQSFSVCNYPVSSTLIERKGWQLSSGSSDDVNGTFPGTLEHIGELTDVKDQAWNGDSLMFYMHENVQQPVASGLSPADRDKHNGADYGYEGFCNAPAGATYVVVKGTYSGPKSSKDTSPVSGEVSYTIHLGNFGDKTGSYDNFTVRRNAKYRYIVTVNGVSSIITEAQYTGDEYAAKDSGAEGVIEAVGEAQTNITVDSHYETVMVKIPASLVSTSSYIISSRTPKESVDYVKGDSKLPSDIGWIKFAKPSYSGNTLQFKAYPGTGNKNLTDVKGLVEDLQKSGSTKTYAVKVGDYYYSIAYVDEYWYSDIDLKSFVNADPRTMTLTTSIYVSKDGQSTYIDKPLFTIRQKSIKSVFNLEGSGDDYNPFGIENTEEFSSAVSLSSSGDPGTGDKDFGWSNTKAYFKTGSDKWSDFINASTMGYLDSETIPESAMKKNYGIYQCLSRNRDEDGDGFIDTEEIKWYLPALSQCQDIWYGYLALDSQAQFNLGKMLYWTSSPGSYREWWIDEGVSYGGVYGDSMVRCVRSLKTYDKATSGSSTYDKSTRTVNVDGLGDIATRTSGSVSIEYTPHMRNDKADMLPKAFQIAKSNVTVTRTSTVDLKALTYSSISSMKNNQTKKVILANPHKENGYVLGYNGKKAVSTGNGFGSVSDMQSAVESVKGTNDYIFTLKKTSKGFELVSTSGSKSPNNSLVWAVVWGNKSTFTLNSGSDVNNSGDLTPDVSKDCLVRFYQSAAYLNAGGSVDYIKYASGKGEWSVWYVWEVLDDPETVTTTDETFSFSEATEEDICSRYYHETAGDKGWRIPNEKEFGLMIKYIEDEFRDASGNVSPYPVARTRYYRQFDKNEKINSGYFYIGTITTGPTHGFCDDGSYKGVIRCVRDVSPTK